MPKGIKGSGPIKAPQNHMDIPVGESIDVSLGTMNPFNDETNMPPQSSIPIGELTAKTAGWQPRSRSASSRESQFRSRAERVDYYKKQMQTINVGKTHIPEALKKDGFFYMWVRESVRDKYDGNNLRNKEMQGWEYVDADEAPELAFVDQHGDINDSVTRTRTGGLILMKLDEELYQFLLDRSAKERNQQSRMENILARMPDLNPFGFGVINNQEAYFGQMPNQSMSF